MFPVMLSVGRHLIIYCIVETEQPVFGWCVGTIHEMVGHFLDFLNMMSSQILMLMMRLELKVFESIYAKNFITGTPNLTLGIVTEQGVWSTKDSMNRLNNTIMSVLVENFN
jgi:hypothetical protein